MTRTKTFKKYATEAEPAALKDSLQIMTEILKIIDRKAITLPQRRRLITSTMILDEKYDVNGAFERLKARSVARGK
jgi:hypothetical protein